MTKDQAKAQAMTDLLDVVISEMRMLIDLERRGVAPEIGLDNMTKRYPEGFVQFIRNIHGGLAEVAGKFVNPKGEMQSFVCDDCGGLYFRRQKEECPYCAADDWKREEG